VQISNTETIPGKRVVQHIGLVQGNTIRAKNIGRDIMAGFKSIVGGEISGYTELMTEARTEAMNRMKEEAMKLGANAVVNVRFTTASVMQGAAELLAYGTAVVVEDNQPAPAAAEPPQQQY
jgi:uncharacterized protein YbjQ (UPF0145 family)